MDIMALTGINWNLTFSIFFILLVALIAVYSWVVPQGDKRWWGLALLMTVFVITALQPVSELGRMLLLDAAAFAAVALVAGQSLCGSQSSEELSLDVDSGRTLCRGRIISGRGFEWSGNDSTRSCADQAGGWAAGGRLCPKLALIPFYFWLPNVAETTSPMTTALIVGVVGIAEFIELAGLRLADPLGFRLVTRPCGSPWPWLRCSAEHCWRWPSAILNGCWPSRRSMIWATCFWV